MVRAYVLIITSAGTSPEILPKLRELDGVVKADIVAGEFDIIAEVETETNHDLRELVAAEIQALTGVGATRTSIVLE